jgi:hypothetical protein
MHILTIYLFVVTMALRNDEPVLSSDRALHIYNTAVVKQLIDICLRSISRRTERTTGRRSKRDFGTKVKT